MTFKKILETNPGVEFHADLKSGEKVSKKCIQKNYKQASFMNISKSG